MRQDNKVKLAGLFGDSGMNKNAENLLRKKNLKAFLVMLGMGLGKWT